MGFMGSGKTTTGRLLAARLGWDFLDFDAEVEARSGRSVESFFERGLEDEFRDLEVRVGRELLDRRDVVLASGGGWPCAPGRTPREDQETLSVWLQVDPATAVRRVEEAGGGRPLLAGSDPAGRAEELLEKRLRYYGEARLHLDTEGRTPREVAEAIARYLSPKEGIRKAE